MKKILILLAITAITAGAFCQTDTSSVSYVAYWSLGDSYNFSVSKTSQQWSGDSLKKDEKSEYTANFEVIDSTKTSYTVMWTFSNQLSNTWDIPDELLGELSKYEITEVVYTTTEMGEFTGIENWKELGETMRSMFTDVFKFIAKDSLEFDVFMKVARPILDMYSSKEGVEQMVFPELMLFHFPFGAMIPVGDTVMYDELFPNLLGGEPVRADARLWFEEVDFEEERSLLVQETKLNPDDTKAFLKEFLARMGMEGTEMEKVLSEAVYIIENSTRYDYYYYPGVPVKIQFNRNILIDIGDQNNRRFDTITVELLFDES
jgi:hypothetical protein